MKRVLYLHGFASSPESRKTVLLRPLLAPHGIELDPPDLNVPSFETLDFDAMVSLSLGRTTTPPDAIAASSLGALVALEIARRVPRPLVLIAPALGVGARWLSRLPAGDPVTVWNHAREADAPVHRRFFERMNEVHVDDDPPSAPVTVIMGRNDETVPFEIVNETWERWSARGLAPGSKFIAIDGGDHSLTDHIELIAREIVASCS